MSALRDLVEDAAAGLTEAGDGVLIRPMLTIDRALSLFLDQPFAEKTRKDYGRLLEKFIADYPPDMDVSRLTEEHCLAFLARYRDKSRGYRATVEATLGSFFRWLYTTRKIRTNPMSFVPRTTRPNPDEMEVTTVSEDEVAKILHAAGTWTEILCVNLLAYLGPRRSAAAQLRLRDYDRRTGHMLFREKGGKTISKPVPHELAEIIEAAVQVGVLREPGDYLIPPRGPLSRPGRRCDRIVWEVVKDLAARAGVEAHVHSLRAAFACFYLRTHNRDIVALKELMGHSSVRTTEVYLRRMDRRAAMETVRDLSWGSVAANGNGQGAGNPQTAGIRLEESSLVGAGGFEPPQADSSLWQRLLTESELGRLH